MAVVPVMAFILMITEKVMTRGTIKAKAAYSQSAGYAEQCMNAIKIVMAFGMEETELANYNHHLEPAR